MPTFLSTNLKFLRKKFNKSQSDIGYQLKKAHTSIGNWEKAISEPSLAEIEEIARIFEISPADLLYTDLSKVQEKLIEYKTEKQKKVQVKVQDNVQVRGQSGSVTQAAAMAPISAPKVITIDTSGGENMVFVPVKARAGYLAGYADPEYIKTLPAYRLPGYTMGTYRMFEVEGTSMYNTLQTGDRCIARWTQLSEGKDDRVYVVVTRTEGVLIKRCIFRLQEAKIVCKSDNNHSGKYPPIVLNVSDVLELWYVVERWTRQLPAPGEIYTRIARLEAEFAILKQQLKNLPKIEPQ